MAPPFASLKSLLWGLCQRFAIWDRLRASFAKANGTELSRRNVFTCSSLVGGDFAKLPLTQGPSLTSERDVSVARDPMEAER